MYIKYTLVPALFAFLCIFFLLESHHSDQGPKWLQIMAVLLYDSGVWGGGSIFSLRAHVNTRTCVKENMIRARPASKVKTQVSVWGDARSHSVGWTSDLLTWCHRLGCFLFAQLQPEGGIQQRHKQKLKSLQLCPVSPVQRKKRITIVLK